MENREIAKLKKQFRTLFANYMASEGCSCCQNVDQHKINLEQLAKALNVRKYKDGSGYDFSKYESR